MIPLSYWLVFLGPNDLLGHAPDGGGRYLKFASEAWAPYIARIASIIDNARQHNVSVIWMATPEYA